MSTHRASTGDLTRRAALGALAAGGIGFVALGPRGSRERTGGRLVLDYWEKWTRHEGDAMRAIIDDFNASQDRLFVRYIVVSDIGQKSLVAIAGGDPPDLIGLYAFNVPGYAESGALTRLDDLAPSHGVTLEHYAPGVRPVMRHADRWWAVVNTAGSVALYYNRAHFREVGLDPDAPPATIAQLDEAHRRLVRRGPSGSLERAGFFHPEPGWWSWLWAYHFGGRIYDPANDLALADSPENIAALEWMASYARDLGVDHCRAFRDSFGNYFTPENPFLSGKLSMIIQGPWVANLIGKFAPDLDYGVAPFPVSPGLEGAADPIGLIDTDVLVIPRGAKHPEASMEFIAFTQRPENVERLAAAHFKPSPLAASSESFRRTHPNRGVAVHEAILRSARAYVPPRTRVWQQFKDDYDATVQRVWRLEASPAEAMAGMQRRAQAYLDHAADQRRRRGLAGPRAGGGGAP